MNRDFWNERFSYETYAYGVSPNDFLRKEAEKLKLGQVLLPAEGEGRNAVYLASRGWNVRAFDISEEGRTKAKKLASKHGVKVNYKLMSYLDVKYENNFDLVVCIFNHVLPEHRKEVFGKYIKSLKPGGRIILEGFHKTQLGMSSGGPKREDMLFSEEMIRGDFAGIKIERLNILSRELDEGEFHQGKANVLQMTGVKPL